MEREEQLTKPIIETKYLSAENAGRYRSIMRLFFQHYEKLKYWLYQAEVYEELKKERYFSDYTEEQCKQDLEALKGWGNLIAIQDTKKAATLEEFKNKKYRYQMSEISVEIERMIVRLENLHIEGSSLEPNLLERILIQIKAIKTISSQSSEEIYGWWSNLNADFVRLNQNYQDYMRDLNSVKAEEMMKTKEFLLFKDRLIEYLRSFIKSLQRNASVIEQELRELDDALMQGILAQVVTYECSIPRLDVEISEEEISDMVQGRFASIYEWFLGKNGSDSEVGAVFDMTNEIIRKITRYAARISEQNNLGANRREEYYHLAVLFSQCETMEQANRLSACAFGVEKPFHLKGNFVRRTESINSGVYEETPMVQHLSPRVRGYKERSERKSIQDRSREKQELKAQLIQKMESEKKLLQSYIVDDCLDFSKLPCLKKEVRDVFLVWLSKALEKKDARAKTEDGVYYYIENPHTTEVCVLQCEDGAFHMPAFVLRFEPEETLA